MEEREIMGIWAAMQGSGITALRAQTFNIRLGFIFWSKNTEERLSGCGRR